jgi:hypothetical protein
MIFLFRYCIFSIMIVSTMSLSSCIGSSTCNYRIVGNKLYYPPHLQMQISTSKLSLNHNRVGEIEFKSDNKHDFFNLDSAIYYPFTPDLIIKPSTTYTVSFLAFDSFRSFCIYTDSTGKFYKADCCEN